MMGVFVQVNTFGKCWKKAAPIGYVLQENGCWDWVGANTQGYGIWKGKRAHRVMYEAVKGRIPEGKQLDHLCRNRACVNPDHLEVVTSKENTLRGDGLTANNARKTHCKYGHEYSNENTHWRNGRRPGRECRTCNRLRMRHIRAVSFLEAR